MREGKKSPVMDFSVKKIVDYMNSQTSLPFVLLGVGPMSPLVIKVYLEVTRDTQSPAMLIGSTPTLISL